MPSRATEPWVAGPGDAAVVARLLDDFNTEFGTSTPGVLVLEDRLRALLPSGRLVALLAGRPAVGLALVTLRPSVWSAGPVGMLEELYVVPERRDQGIGGALLAAAEALVLRRGGASLQIEVDEGDVAARRFYERHGYLDHEPGRTDRMLHYGRELQGT